MAKFEKGNTIGNRFPTGEKQTETARAGGKASAAAKKERKSLKDALLALLEMEHKGKNGEIAKGYEVIAIGLYNKAMHGDTKAIKLLSELVGEYKQQTDITSGGKALNIVVRSEDTKAAIEKLYDADTGI